MPRLLLMDDRGEERSRLVAQLKANATLSGEFEVIPGDLANLSPLSSISEEDCVLLSAAAHEVLDVLRSMRNPDGLSARPVLVLMERTGEPSGIEIFRAGAMGYLERSALTSSGLRQAIQQAIERHAVLREEHGGARRTIAELQHVYQHAPVGMCVLDIDLRFVRINDRLAALNGLPPEAHIGRTVEEILPSLVGPARKVTSELLATGRAVENREFSGETPAQPGVQRSWTESWYPLQSGDGIIWGFGVVVEEITARKQADAALLAERELLETVIRHMPVSICWLRGSDLRVQLINPAHQAVAPGKDMIGKTWDEIWGETGLGP